MNRPTAFFAALAAAALLPAGGARAETTLCTPVTSLPAVISAGGVYCLTQDLATAIETGAAITINANNVTLDCNERKLGGLAAGDDTSAIGIIASSRTNVTIRNCNVRGFLYGIALFGSPTTSGGHLVEDNRLDGNTFTGILASGDGSVVRRNRIFDTGGALTSGSWTMGINASGSIEVSDNIIQGMHSSQDRPDAYGMMVSDNYNGSITGNRITGTAADYRVGMRIYSGSRVRIMGNYVAQPMNWSIVCDVAAYGWIRENQWDAGGGGSNCVDAGGNVVVP